MACDSVSLGAGVICGVSLGAGSAKQHAVRHTDRIKAAARFIGSERAGKPVTMATTNSFGTASEKRTADAAP